MTNRVQWLGHSCLLFEIGNKRLIIDPFLTGNPMAAAKAEDLTVDLILISHGHGDHVGDAVSIARRTGAKVVSNYEISVWLQETQGLPADQTIGMQHGGGTTLDGIGRIKLTLAFHGSVLPDGKNGGNPCGFLLTLPDGTKIYDAADTALFGDMRLIGDEGLDLALLPIGDFYTMGPEDALRALTLLEPKQVVPIHYNTFPPIKQDAHAWAALVRESTAVKPCVLEPGEWLDLSKPKG